MIRKGRVRWFGHVECKDTDWLRCCTMTEVLAVRRTGQRKTTWWDGVEEDIESVGICQDDTQIC